MKAAPVEKDYTQPLRQLMEQAGIPSFRALASATGISEWTIQQVRRGQIQTLRLAAILKLSQALGVPLSVLLDKLGSVHSDVSSDPSIAAQTPKLSTGNVPSGEPSSPDAAKSLVEAAKLEQMQQEYQRLQTQLAQQRESLATDFQTAALVAIEAWLLQWPTAAYAAQQNPQAPAVRLIPLMQPLERLLDQWGVRAIAPVGAEVEYDPQIHQLMEGHAQPRDRVRIRYTGYWHEDRLLHRAKVSPVKGIS